MTIHYGPLITSVTTLECDSPNETVISVYPSNTSVSLRLRFDGLWASWEGKCKLLFGPAEIAHFMCGTALQSSYVNAYDPYSDSDPEEENKTGRTRTKTTDVQVQKIMVGPDSNTVSNAMFEEWSEDEWSNERDCKMMATVYDIIHGMSNQSGNVSVIKQYVDRWTPSNHHFILYINITC